MQNKSKREKLNDEYNELKKKEIEAREKGNYDKIGELHMLINNKYEEIIHEMRLITEEQNF